MLALLNLSLEDSPGEKLLKDRGIMVWPAPDGYIVRVPDRGGLIPFRIEGEEMDAILSLGRIKRLEVEVTDIRIEVYKT